ncbi:uncharacterized protein LOC126798569 [Argentina anserina]|uniref:uncharacterized protein LOC126798569 n=1 Tax=Argentina anserina TaxID=57926 RepID=UPI00217646D2|nr:uncharacterized protein LOC126798569 [Potentilla anserina]
MADRDRLDHPCIQQLGLSPAPPVVSGYRRQKTIIPSGRSDMPPSKPDPISRPATTEIRSLNQADSSTGRPVSVFDRIKRLPSDSLYEETFWPSHPNEKSVSKAVEVDEVKEDLMDPDEVKEDLMDPDLMDEAYLRSIAPEIDKSLYTDITFCRVCELENEHLSRRCPFFERIPNPRNTHVGFTYTIVCKCCDRPRQDYHSDDDKWEGKAVNDPAATIFLRGHDEDPHAPIMDCTKTETLKSFLIKNPEFRKLYQSPNNFTDGSMWVCR